MRHLFLLLLAILLLPAPARGGAVWRAAGPAGAIDLVDVVAHGHVVAVADAAGAVWLSADGGISWRLVLPAVHGSARSANDARIEAEAWLADVLADVEFDEIDPDVAEEAREAVLHALEDLGDPDEPAASDEGRGAHPRLALRLGTTLLVGRDDGLWAVDVAADAAVRVWAAPVVAVACGGVRCVAAVPDGAVVSDDLAHFVAAPVPPLSDVAAGAGWLALGRHAVYASDDALGWRRVAAPRGAWASVVAPDDGPAWLLGDEVAVGRGDAWAVHRPGARILGVVPVPDGTIGVTEHGLWLTRDLGRTWEPHGPPPHAGVRAAAIGAGTLLLATDAGLLALADDTGALVSDDAPPLDVLIEAVAASHGRRPPGRGARRVLPSLVVEARVVRADDRRAVLDGGLTGRGAVDGAVVVALAWSPRRSSSADAMPALRVEERGGAWRVVVDGTDDGVRFARATVETRAQAVRRLLALWSERALLLRERGAGEADLRRAVRLALRLAEVEALVDAMTDGALARHRAARSAGGRG